MDSQKLESVQVKAGKSTTKDDEKMKCPVKKISASSSGSINAASPKSSKRLAAKASKQSSVAGLTLTVNLTPVKRSHDDSSTKDPMVSTDQWGGSASPTKAAKNSTDAVMSTTVTHIADNATKTTICRVVSPSNTAKQPSDLVTSKIVANAVTSLTASQSTTTISNVVTDVTDSSSSLQTTLNRLSAAKIAGSTIRSTRNLAKTLKELLPNQRSIIKLNSAGFSQELPGTAVSASHTSNAMPSPKSSPAVKKTEAYFLPEDRAEGELADAATESYQSTSHVVVTAIKREKTSPSKDAKLASPGDDTSRRPGDETSRRPCKTNKTVGSIEKSHIVQKHQLKHRDATEFPDCDLCQVIHTYQTQCGMPLPKNQSWGENHGCGIPYCENRRKTSGRPFHKFPHDFARFMKWRANCQSPAIDQLSYEDRAKKVLCGDHFEKDQYIGCEGGTLIKKAIPTLFAKAAQPTPFPVEERSSPYLPEVGEASARSITIEERLPVPPSQFRALGQRSGHPLPQSVPRKPNHSAIAQPGKLIACGAKDDYAIGDNRPSTSCIKPQPVVEASEKLYYSPLVAPAPTDLKTSPSSKFHRSTKIAEALCKHLSVKSADSSSPGVETTSTDPQTVQTDKAILQSTQREALGSTTSVETKRVSSKGSYLLYAARQEELLNPLDAIQKHYKNELSTLKKSQQSKICRLQKRVAQLTVQCDALKRHIEIEPKPTQGKCLKMLSNFVPPTVLELVSHKMKHGDNGRHYQRWPTNLKKFALSMYQTSPRAYAKLSETFVLPARSSVRALAREALLQEYRAANRADTTNNGEMTQSNSTLLADIDYSQFEITAVHSADQNSSALGAKRRRKELTIPTISAESLADKLKAVFS